MSILVINCSPPFCLYMTYSASYDSNISSQSPRQKLHGYPTLHCRYYSDVGAYSELRSQQSQQHLRL